MPTSLLDRLRVTLRRASNSTADLATALDQARAGEADALAVVELQAKIVADGFLDDDAKRGKDRAKLADLRGLAEDAAAIRGELEKRYGAAVDTEAEGKRRAASVAAKGKADALGATLAERYTSAAGTMLALMREIGEANAAIAVANADLPAGERDILNPEMLVRATPGLPWLPDEVETVEHWAFEDGTPVADAIIGNVVDYGGGVGSYKSARIEGIDEVEVGQPVRLRQFRKVTSYTPTAGVYFTELVRMLRIPDLYSDRLILGSPNFPDTWTAEVDLARQAEQALAESAKPAPVEAADRPRRVEYRPVWTDAEVEKANSPATDYHDKVVRPGARIGAGTSPFALPARAGGRR